MIFTNFFLFFNLNISGLGSAAGYLFGAVKLDEIAMYGVGLVIFIPCSIISLLAARERRYIPSPTERMSNSHGIRNVIATFKSFPILFYYLILTQLFAWYFSFYF